MQYNLKTDELCLLYPEMLTSPRPYSNVSEYCLRDGDFVSKYLYARGIVDEMSDYELLSAVVEVLDRDTASFASRRIRTAINELCETDTSGMPAETIWELSARILDERARESIFDFDLDLLGVPMNDSLPESIGNTRILPVSCPFGVKSFDLSRIAMIDCRTNIEKEIDESSSVAIFFKGFEFAVPNEYTATKSLEKLQDGMKMTDKERPILLSQLCRSLILKCSVEGKRFMAFMPSSPDVRAMGEFARLIEYADDTIRSGRLDITVFAPDAVGLCFAQSLSRTRYKKITAETGICGNGCGCADVGHASYWGADTLNIKRASLSSTPAYIGK